MSTFFFVKIHIFVITILKLLSGHQQNGGIGISTTQHPPSPSICSENKSTRAKSSRWSIRGITEPERSTEKKKKDPLSRRGKTDSHYRQYPSPKLQLPGAPCACASRDTCPRKEKEASRRLHCWRERRAQLLQHQADCHSPRWLPRTQPLPSSMTCAASTVRLPAGSWKTRPRLTRGLLAPAAPGGSLAPGFPQAPASQGLQLILERAGSSDPRSLHGTNAGGLTPARQLTPTPPRLCGAVRLAWTGWRPQHQASAASRDLEARLTPAPAALAPQQLRTPCQAVPM